MKRKASNELLPSPRFRSSQGEMSTQSQSSQPMAVVKKRSRGYRQQRRYKTSKSLLSVHYANLCITPSVGGPPAMKIPFMYTQNLAFTTTLGAMKTQVFRLNSLYDPDLTGTGQQPPSYDQWTALYGTYRVVGCSYEIQALIQGTQVPCLIASCPLTSSGTLSTIDAYRGNMGGKYQVFSGYEKAVLKDYVRIDKYLGISKERLMTDDLLSSAYNTNPGIGLYLHIAAQPTDGATEVNIQYIVKLKYYTVLSKKTEQEIS